MPTMCLGGREDSLQRVMNDSCMFHKCGSPGVQGVLKTQTVAEMNKCSVKTFVDEDTGRLADGASGAEDADEI